MNRPRTPSPHDDAALQQLHAHALHSLSPATLARLREARHAATSPARRRHPGWWMATACSAVVALALGYGFSTQPPASPVTPAIVAAEDSSEVLDENPDLYVWLAATDLAME